MMGHKNRATTRLHYVPVLNSRLQRASESMDGRFNGWPTVQTDLQNTSAKPVQSRPDLTATTRRRKASNR